MDSAAPAPTAASAAGSATGSAAAPAGEPIARATARLREAGLRVTAQRIAVLMAVESLPGHSDAESVRNAARAVTGRLSLQSTYNVLRVLTDAALSRCTQFPGHPARYETERHDNHHHFVCRHCGGIVDTDCQVGGAPCLRSSLPESYAVDEAAVTFWGVCPDCTAADRAGG
jgi:Fur family transcriptional regulator, stress-responsive regulator